MMDFKKELGKLRGMDSVRTAPRRTKVYPEFADCELCHGTLYKSDGQICSCMAEYKLRNRLRSANVGARYFDVTLDFYDQYLGSTSIIMYNGLKSGCSSKRYGIDHFVRFIDNYVKTLKKRVIDGRGFIICGGTGCGKTGATCYIVREAIKQGFKAYYIDTNDLLDTIYTTMNGNDQEIMDARRKLHMLDVADVLVLDDIGSEYIRNTEFLYNRFLRIIKSRYSRNKPTIMTSNLAPEKIMSGFDEGIVGRLSSVLAEFQVIFMQDAADVRVVKSAKRSLSKDMSRERKKEV